MRFLLILAFLFLSSQSFAAERLHLEKTYQEQWCNGKGQFEFVLPDKTRCDCLTKTNAVEFDFGSKWAEAIGQSLYLFATDRQAGWYCFDIGKR